MDRAPFDSEAHHRSGRVDRGSRLPEDLPPRPRSTSIPPIVWLILGVLLVALFVLVMGGLSPYL